MQSISRFQLFSAEICRCTSSGIGRNYTARCSGLLNTEAFEYMRETSFIKIHQNSTARGFSCSFTICCSRFCGRPLRLIPGQVRPVVWPSYGDCWVIETSGMNLSQNLFRISRCRRVDGRQLKSRALDDAWGVITFTSVWSHILLADWSGHGGLSNHESFGWHPGTQIQLPATTWLPILSAVTSNVH